MIGSWIETPETIINGGDSVIIIIVVAMLLNLLRPLEDLLMLTVGADPDLQVVIIADQGKGDRTTLLHEDNAPRPQVLRTSE